MKLTTLLKEILDSNSVLDIKSTKTEDLIPHARKSNMGNEITVPNLVDKTVGVYLYLDRGDWDEWKSKYIKTYGNVGSLKLSSRGKGTFEIVNNPKYYKDKNKSSDVASNFYKSSKSNYKGD